MNKFLIRISDFLFSLVLLIILSPLLLILGTWIKIDSKGPVFFRQNRVGKNNRDFKLWKFRTMNLDSEKGGLITTSKNDKRITNAGSFLRRFKLDELPQLLNVLAGEMSIVGPRPEVRKYVDMYTVEQAKVLVVKPGITDYASIKYSNENELLEKAADPLKMYTDEIMPAKIKLNMEFINKPTFRSYLTIMGLTFLKIIRS
jgi:lipopolysaccharide/colanic/teichoic acid biosynthesis glycosyltransferase